MAEQRKIRLHQVASELNVGKDSIVDFLTKSGFEISNKPTSLVTDEMIEALLKSFIKEKKVAENFKKKFGKDAPTVAQEVVPPTTKTPEPATTIAIEDELFTEEIIISPAPTETGTIEVAEEPKTAKKPSPAKEPEVVEPAFQEPKVGEIIDIDRFKPV